MLDGISPLPDVLTFLNRLDASGLLANGQRAEIVGLAASATGLEAVVERLVDRRMLTDWQARRLAEGATRPAFFIDKYKLLQPLDPGNMGVVYKAEKPGIGRLVALKMIHDAHWGNPKIAERFEREIRALARLDHPNIVYLHDRGMHDDGSGLPRPYLVMQYIDGRRIDLALAGQDERIILCCILQVADALEHARLRAIVHRDIKPSNILITWIDGVPTVKLIDFGLARPATDPTVTDADRTVGTLAYMAPEQRKGGPVDSRSDLFSLGCVLFELLAGQRPLMPFWTDGATAPNLRTYRPDLPEMLAEILSRLLASDPERRYATPAKLAAKLGAIVRGPAPAAPSAAACACFARREDATPDMRRALLRYTKLVFYGVSNQKLADYLQGALDAAGPGGVPWRSIEVYFANDSVGESFESNGFVRHVKQARQAIADVLLGREPIPALREVVFRQNLDPRWQTGCLLGDETSGRPVFRASYVISNLAPTVPEESLTFKLDVDGRDAEAYERRLFAAYFQTGVHAVSLGTFQPTAWDRSVGPWDEFCCRKVQREGVERFADFARFAPGDRVLELAAGTGRLSRTLSDRLAALPNTAYTAMEASPAMLGRAREALPSEAGLALGHAPTRNDDREDLDIEDRRYTKILIHLSLAALAANDRQLRQLAKWCAGYLKPGGQVLFSAHSPVVRIENRSANDPDRDPLRQALREEARRRGVGPALRTRPHRFTVQELRDAFAAAMFMPAESASSHIPITVSERLMMWSVPAILNQFLDIQADGVGDTAAFVASALQAAGVKLHDGYRTIGFWSFTNRA